MAAFRYDPPATQNDFIGDPKEDELLQKWSDLIGSYFKGEIDNLRNVLGQEPLFFSEVDRPLDSSTPTATVPWNGFPRNIQLRVNFDRANQFQEAEIRGQVPIGFTDRTLSQTIEQPYRQQDEYLEWVPIKRSGRVVKYAFTAEGPEYWEFLAENNRDAVLALYKTFTGRDVDWSEISWDRDVWGRNRSGNPIKIYKIGDYNPYNAVNLEECAAHLTHPANTLGAEIDLAAKATVQRADINGNLVSERRRLACCSNFGDPNRNSDPEIGRQVNLSVRGGVSLTLANPVGLYIQRFDSGRIADKDGNAIPDWWQVVRGKDGRVLRAVFGPPETSQLTLEDVRIVANNETLDFGGQLAELITMVIYARAINVGLLEPSMRRCVNRCCVQKGNAPDRSPLDQVKIDDSCSKDSWVNAFPELGEPQPISPFDRRFIGRGLMG